MTTFFGSWDVYSVGVSGTTVTLAAGSSPTISGEGVADITGGGDTSSAVVGDTAADSGGHSPLTYEGSVSIAGVTGYVVDFGGNFFLLVQHGADVSAGGSDNVASTTWDMTLCFLAGTMIATPDGEDRKSV